jgi:hypothetical protein
MLDKGFSCYTYCFPFSGNSQKLAFY